MSERPPVPSAFVDLIGIATRAIGAEPLGPVLEERLNFDFSADGPWYEKAVELCRQGAADGWLCAREAAGIRFGRAVPPGAATQNFSVDVVEMVDVVGPHHSHPNGEIDLVMPIDGKAAFDGRGAGWKVYPPGSAHCPTVTGGKALVLYLLPEGAIEFTRD